MVIDTDQEDFDTIYEPWTSKIKNIPNEKTHPFDIMLNSESSAAEDLECQELA